MTYSGSGSRATPSGVGSGATVEKANGPNPRIPVSAMTPASHYTLSRYWVVHRLGKCIGLDQAIDIWTRQGNEEVVGWLYVTPCKRCRP